MRNANALADCPRLRAENHLHLRTQVLRFDADSDALAYMRRRTHIDARVRVCAQVPVAGYMLLHVDAVDHDAVHMRLDSASGENPCWLAYFSHVPLGVGLHALQFSVRDGDLEPSGLEAETCHVNIRQERVAAPALVQRDDAGSEIISPLQRVDAGGEVIGQNCSMPRQPLPCMRETLDFKPPELQDSDTLSPPTRCRLPAAAAEQREVAGIVQGEREAEWDRFERFKAIVCSKCARRGMECGCRPAEHPRRHHPAFEMLSDFTQDMLAARVRAVAGGPEQTHGRNKRVVVHLYKQGLGNQLLAMVNALLLALVSKRLLAVHVHTEQVYDLEPVLDLNAFVNGLAAPCRNYIKVDMSEPQGLALVLCGQLHHARHYYTHTHTHTQTHTNTHTHTHTHTHTFAVPGSLNLKP